MMILLYVYICLFDLYFQEEELWRIEEEIENEQEEGEFDEDLYGVDDDAAAAAYMQAAAVVCFWFTSVGFILFSVIYLGHTMSICPKKFFLRKPFKTLSEQKHKLTRAKEA